MSSVTYDPAKRQSNLAKHGIDLAECEAVFDGPMVTFEDPRGYDEQRFVSLGLLRGSVVVLVWTGDATQARLISCRKAGSHDQKKYFEAYPRH